LKINTGQWTLRSWKASGGCSVKYGKKTSFIKDSACNPIARAARPFVNFEVTEGYKEVQGPSITVSFPVSNDPKTKFLVWTTTPWTLFSNVALAVGPKIIYVKIKDGEDVFIMAKDRMAAYYKDLSTVNVMKEFPGTETCRHGLRTPV